MKRVGTSRIVAMPIQKREKRMADMKEKARTERVKVVKRRRGGREMARVVRRNVWGR